MTHEFNEIVKQAFLNQKRGIQNILVTVVDLDGSSYRKPGVRMLISSDGNKIGAVSGGCIENEIQQRAQTIFETGISKIITYDGRYRLGCEGVLYILLEPFQLSSDFIQAFSKNLQNRESFKIISLYQKKDIVSKNFGSFVQLQNKPPFTFFKNFVPNQTEKLTVFEQKMDPSFRLLIIGGEHDSVKLCKQSSQLGWEVDVITSMKSDKFLSDFPGANSVTAQTPELIDFTHINTHTAIVIMNHNYSYDLRYLIKLYNFTPSYIGILGAAKRRERLFNELFELIPEITDTFLEKIHTPAGLNIGAETPEEIAISILAEILSVIRNKEVFSLKKITGRIHS
ncbi:XdhC family protein [Tenacibaculum sp.]|nr:XdhC family protein [Tenacibaculum sp.]